MNKTKTFKTLSLAALFAAVTVICSYLAVPTPVPFTLQTLAIFLSCAYLGFKGGFLSTLAYLLLGVVGLPVFAGFRGGFSAFLDPTGGFILGFLFIPLAHGVLCKLFGKRLEALWLFVGLLLCYAVGSLWYLVYTDAKAYPAVLLVSVLPFIIPDLIKLFAAVYLAKVLRKATGSLLHGDKKLKPSLIASNMENSVDIFTFAELDSTNSEAARRMRSGAQLPALFIAEKQTAGRGRRGRSFFSEGGLYMTLALDLKQADTVGLTTLAAVAVAEAVEELTGERIGIKWVNDLYLGDKKICGILCESISEPQTGENIGSIIGIGVNLNVKSFPEELCDIAGSVNSKTATKAQLAVKITENIFKELEADNSHIDRYKERSVVLGKQILFEENGIVFEGEAKNISENGALIVATEQGEKTLSSGEITLRIKK